MGLRKLYESLPHGLKQAVYNGYKSYTWQIRNAKNVISYGTTDFITDLNIEINTSCNRRCDYCPNSVFDRGLLENEKLMPESLFKKIIDELAEVSFSGRISPHFYGEPLLDKRLLGLVAYTRQKLPKVKIVLVTNGDHLTLESYNNLVNSGVSSFCVTQHGKTMSKNMTALFKYLKENPREKVKITYLKYTEDTPLFNRGGEVKPSTINLNPRCRSADNPVIIDFAGNVALCCNDYHSSVKLGNLNNSSLIEIWNSSKYRLLRDKLRKGVFELEICKKCVGLD